MRSVEELIKESVAGINSDYEFNAKGGIKHIINEIVRQQDIIKTAEKAIKDLQGALKGITVKQVPSNFLV